MSLFGAIIYNHNENRLTGIVIDSKKHCVVDTFSHKITHKHNKDKSEYIQDLSDFVSWLRKHQKKAQFTYQGPKMVGSNKRSGYAGLGQSHQHDLSTDSEAFIDVIKPLRLGNPKKPQINKTQKAVIEMVYEIPIDNHEDYVTAAAIALKLANSTKKYEKIVADLKMLPSYETKLEFIKIWAQPAKRKGRRGYALLKHAVDRYNNPTKQLAQVKTALEDAVRADYDLFLSSSFDFS